MIQSWQTLWARVTSPYASNLTSYEKERATLHAATLLVIVVPLIIFSIAILLFPIVNSRFIPTVLLCTVIYIGFYALSRTSYYQWAMRVTIWFAVISLVVIFQIIAQVPVIFILNFFSIPILLSAFFLDLREAVVNLVIVIGITVYLEASISGSVEYLGVPLLLIEVGFLSIVAAVITRQYQRQAITSETRYRHLMEANYEGIAVIDFNDAKILDVNPAITNILGYSVDELINRYPIEFVTQEYKPLSRELWEGRIQNSAIELQMKHKSGHIVDVEVRLRTHNYQDDPSYVLTVIDISDRKQVENIVIETEERFRAIFNGSTHYIGVLDETGKVVEFNNRSYEKFGLQLHDVVGRQLWDFVYWAHSERSKAQVKAVVQQAIDGMSSRHEIQARDKDGNTIYLDFSLQPLLDENGQTRMIVAESRDMTAYKQAEAQRRTMQNRYQALFKNTTDAVFIVDMDGNIRDANQRASELLNVDYDTIIQSHMRDFVAPEQINQTQQLLGRLQAGDKVSNLHERRMIRADGSLFDAETIGILITDEDNKSHHILSMVRDVTERKRLEQERFQSALDRERTDLLAHFIENASHHFRTPITNMKTRMYLLPRVLDRPEKREEQIDILNRELERLQNILNDLLTVLRLQKDDTEYSLSRIPVNELLSVVRQTFSGRHEYPNYEWVWQLNADESIVFGDRGRLSTAIVNLVDNATTYTPEGGKITIRSFTTDGIVAIDVIDSGIGITDDDLPHIFDDFYRGQEAMTEDSTSSGLGLSITQLTIKRHNGKLFASSPTTGGAHFQILLPESADWTTPQTILPDAMLQLPTTIN